MLAISAPWMFSNVAVEFSRTIYASDASLAVGAVVKSEIPDCLSRALWWSSDRKGCSARLDGLARSMLAAVGEEPVDDVEDGALREPLTESPFKPPLFYFDFVEICGRAGVVSRQAGCLYFGFVGVKALQPV